MADLSPSMPISGAYLWWLQPITWARHSLWASFSWGAGHFPPSFMTTCAFSHAPDMNHSPLSFCNHWHLQLPQSRFLEGQREMPPPEGGTVWHTKWGWHISTEAWHLSWNFTRVGSHATETPYDTRVQVSSLRTPSAVREQGTKTEQSQPAGLPQTSEGAVPSPSPYTNLPEECIPQRVWVSGPLTSGPGPSPICRHHIVPGGDTGIWWFNHHDAPVPPAARDEFTPSMPFKYQISSMPKCGAHKLTQLIN